VTYLFVYKQKCGEEQTYRISSKWTPWEIKNRFTIIEVYIILNAILIHIFILTKILILIILKKKDRFAVELFFFLESYDNKFIQKAWTINTLLKICESNILISKHLWFLSVWMIILVFVWRNHVERRICLYHLLHHFQH